MKALLCAAVRRAAWTWRVWFSMTVTGPPLPRTTCNAQVNLTLTRGDDVDAQSGAARVLVASDALTRGMDVAGVGAVVNYDAPAFAKTYVHRAGRTARAGQHGKALVEYGLGFWTHALLTHVEHHLLASKVPHPIIAPECEQYTVRMVHETVRKVPPRCDVCRSKGGG